MTNEENRIQRSAYIRRAAWIALVGNSALAALKISAGALSGSLSVLSDGIDSSTDVLIAILTLAAARIAVKPGDEEHSYGHGRIETVASAIISLIVFFAGGQILVRGAQDLIAGAASKIPTPLALWATLISIGGKLIIDMDIEIDPEMTVREAHAIAADVERSIKEHLPDVYDVIVHMEPGGNDEEERFGLSKPEEGLEG